MLYCSRKVLYCGLAPGVVQKTREKEKAGESKRDNKVTEAMDCFSAGCVLAELFLEGAPLFTLSQLFKYREGELNVDTQLSTIDDEGVRVGDTLYFYPCYLDTDCQLVSNQAND